VYGLSSVFWNMQIVAQGNSCWTESIVSFTVKFTIRPLFNMSEIVIEGSGSNSLISPKDPEKIALLWKKISLIHDEIQRHFFQYSVVIKDLYVYTFLWKYSYKSIFFLSYDLSLSWKITLTNISKESSGKNSFRHFNTLGWSV